MRKRVKSKQVHMYSKHMKDVLEWGIKNNDAKYAKNLISFLFSLIVVSGIVVIFAKAFIATLEVI